MLTDWLKLANIGAISCAQKRALVAHFGTPCRVFKSARADLAETGILTPKDILAITSAPEGAAEKDALLLESLEAGFIGFSDADFPELLNHIPSPPLGLFYRGNTELLKHSQLAIVGSRNATPAGRKTTAMFASELSAVGLVITSGLAAGIDASAHRGCLSNGFPTIAVMGTGIDQVYPRANYNLYQEICQFGLVVTEFPAGTAARRGHFPWRNRIISGLSLGTLVVEAGIRSGSLITARLAGEQGREVFAIPGSIHMANSRGCHSLIRDGAKLVETLDDIIVELPCQLGEITGKSDSIPIGDSQGNDNLLYKLIDYAPISLDQLIIMTELTADKVSSMLLDLELKGLVEETPGGYQRLPQ
jgi:DNA processing protein